MIWIEDLHIMNITIPGTVNDISKSTTLVSFTYTENININTTVI